MQSLNMNCRSVSPQTWEHARQALVFFFTRRWGLAGAEDLAHQTLAAILGREDYRFEREEDFLRICYGFATHIMQSAIRDKQKHSGAALDLNMPAKNMDTHGLRNAEVQVFLQEVLRIGKEKLKDSDWQLIEHLIRLESGDPDIRESPESSGKRVKLHRARRRLVNLAGLGRSRV